MVSIQSAGLTNIGGSRNLENQDTFFLANTRFGIFDGHGRQGKQAAEIARNVFAASSNSTIDTMFAITDSILHQSWASISDKKAYGGTTASILQIDPLTGACTVHHVGDSEVCVFDTDEDSGKLLTTDHSPTNIEEFHRIRATGEPAEFYYDTRHHSGPPSPVFEQQRGIWTRAYSNNAYPYNVRDDLATYVVSPRTGEHLSITRSLGDFSMKEYGISAEPSVQVSPPLPKGIRAIVMASDGLWDTMDYSDVRKIVRDPDLIGNAEAAAAALMDSAMDTAESMFGHDADNITVIVIYVSHIIA